MKIPKTEKEQIEWVREDTDNIRYIKNPTERVQMAAVKEHCWSIEYIENPTERVQLEAVRQAGDCIEHIKDPSETVQLAAIKSKWHENDFAIKYIKNPSEKVQLAALKELGLEAIEDIDNPTEAVQRAAIKSNPETLYLIKNVSPAIWQDEDIKRRQLVRILQAAKYGHKDAATWYLKLAEKGCPWPELAAIRKSLLSSGNINESSLDSEDGKVKSRLIHEAAFDMKRYADQARSAIAVGWLDNAIQGMTYGVKVGKVVAAEPIKDLLDENKDAVIKYVLKLMASHQTHHKENYLEDVVGMLRKLGIDWAELAVIEKSIAADMNENFADGKGPGRPGDSRRHGIPKHATLAQLDRISKGSGRKAQLARWQANMRRGRKKSVNEQKSNDHWIRYSKTLKDYLSRDDILDILGDLNAAVEDYGLTARPDITYAIEHNKDNIMRWMLSLMKTRPVDTADRLLSPSLRAFSKLGISWPELQVIKNSISADLRETIAPHGDADNELKMMKAGTKPAVLLHGPIFDELYRPLIKQMGWELVRFNMAGHEHQVIAQKGERARAERIARLVSDAGKTWSAGKQVGPEYHRELGTLLGYSKADVDHFISNLYKETTVNEAKENKIGHDAALTVFDIDETLFHTQAKVLVVRDGKVIKELDNREFNTYILEPGESFDFTQFTDAKFFHDTSVPIERMWKKAKDLLDKVGRRPGSRVIIVTARSDFDDRETFLDTFRKHGLDIDKVHVHRAGNLNLPSAQAKKIIIRKYLESGRFDMVRLFDDAESNLRSFLSLMEDFPDITFKAYMVFEDGSVREYKL